MVIVTCVTLIEDIKLKTTFIDYNNWEFNTFFEFSLKHLEHLFWFILASVHSHCGHDNQNLMFSLVMVTKPGVLRHVPVSSSPVCITYTKLAHIFFQLSCIYCVWISLTFSKELMPHPGNDGFSENRYYISSITPTHFSWNQSINQKYKCISHTNGLLQQFHQ